MDTLENTKTSWLAKQKAIQALEVKGHVDPEALIEVAKDPEHPCHDDFTWDIDKAASERWRDQARALIRRCKFAVVFEETTMAVTQYVSSPEEDDNTFVSLPKLKAKDDVASVLHTEVTMLLGVASRAYGTAVAKRNITGPHISDTLKVIRDMIADLKASMDE